MNTADNSKFFPKLIIFITISLLIQIVIIALKTKNIVMNTTVTKAKETDCRSMKTYGSQILALGSNIAGNNNPTNYEQLRELYNSQNPDPLADGICVSNSYIPITVMYDLFFLKGDPQGIQNNLEALKKNGFYPIIRVTSYTNGNNWIKLYPPTDAKIMGEHLGTALNNVRFPQRPIIAYLNEVNLNDEWAGEANPEEFAESILAFSQGLSESKSTNYQLFFPALSYGATGQNGIDPPAFINRYSAYIDANSKKFEGFGVNGVALNIYGSGYEDIAQQYGSQKSAFPGGNQMPTVITELGPVRNGEAVSNCAGDQEGWQSASTDIVKGVIDNKLSLATMGCFGAITYPAVVHYDGSEPQLVKLNDTSGQITNDTTSTITTKTNTTTNNNNQQEKQTNTSKTCESGLSFSPENPAPGNTVKVTASSKQGLIWVNLSGDGPNGEKINMAGKTPNTTHDSCGYHWMYQVENIKAGTYTFTFSHDCQKFNTKKGQALAPVCADPVTGKITVGGNNSKDAETKSEKPQVPMDQTGQGCFDLSADLGQSKANGGVNFDVTIKVEMKKNPKDPKKSIREGHLQFFSYKDPEKDIDGSHSVIFDHHTYGPDKTQSPIFVKNGSTQTIGYKIKIDECNELGNMDWVSCELSVDKEGNPSASGTNCTTTNQIGEAKNNQNSPSTTVNISTPGKITLDLSTINPINPENLEYCKKPQTSGGDCTNPHDQIVDGNTITMSFPSGNPLIFCGSIDPDKRNQVNGSDRSCIVFYKKT